MIAAQLEGRVFQRLTVVKRIGSDKHKKAIWLCRCECGKEVVAQSRQLTTGNTTSCGCKRTDRVAAMNRTHGKSRSAEHNTWCAMKSRCENQNNQDYHLYGGRGIVVCDRWQSFENFLADMGHRPFPRATIERTDTNGNYEPGNCVWATQKAQTRNKRINRMITINGATKCLGEWCEMYGREYRLVHHRIRSGWTPEAALSTPKQTEWSTKKGFRMGAATAT